MKNAPEKIYGWLDSQLSIARFWGECKIYEHTYYVDKNDADKPLVRDDIYQAEQRTAKFALAVEKLKARDVECEKQRFIDSFDLFIPEQNEQTKTESFSSSGGGDFGGGGSSGSYGDSSSNSSSSSSDSSSGD